MSRARRWLRRIWEITSEMLGDNAYERYAQHECARGGVPLSREEFYVTQLERKYSRFSRCC